MTTTDSKTDSNDRKLVLEMLADGKISVGDAERLLAKLEEAESRPWENTEAGTGKKSRSKHLCIASTDAEGQDEVNLRIPLFLVRAGLALDSFLPSWVPSGIFVLNNTGVTQVDTDFLRENLDDLDMSFDSDEGESVRIFVE